LAGRQLRELYEECKLPWDWHGPIIARCRRLGMVGFSTPFDSASVDFLETLGVPLYKIASFEITDLPLIFRVAATGKPLIISTGMATISEIEEAVRAATIGGCGGLTLLKCVSAYPAPVEDFNLLTMCDMEQRFQCRVGLSDHTAGSAVAVAATALGATVIEKHLSLDREGPDGGFAALPEEFAQMVKEVRLVDASLGVPRYGPLDVERASLQFRRGLWATQDIAPGECFTTENVGILRPAAEMAPSRLAEVLRCCAAAHVSRGTPLSPGLIRQ
jgi:sialic acid synthase SpsE